MTAVDPSVISMLLPTLIQTFIEFKYVTCGSSLKLFNNRQAVRLHSHDVKYGSGSGQQVYFFFII